MKSFKKVAATLALAATLAVGAGSVADLATAHNTSQAQAYTDRNWKYVYNCMPYPSGAFQWRDYDWWEEAWGARDQYVWKFNFYRYC